jgi:hypothetical protein
MRALLLSLLVLLACACGGSIPTEQRVDVFVMSGRPQPPPEDVSVRMGDPVVVHAEGLGPPRVVVFGPDNAPLSTTDVANGQRFTTNAAGKYRVELDGAGGLVLVNVVAR